MKLLVAIPCLNEENSIAGVISSIPKSIDFISKIDVLVIDDGSHDSTAEISARAGAILIKHNKNKGLGEAFKSGYTYAVDNNYDLMISIDGDGQFKADEIPKLIEPILLEDADLVIGSRFIDNKKIPNQSKAKYFGNKLMTLLVGRLLEVKQTDVSSGFRAYSKEALYNLNLHGAFTYTQETFIESAVKKLKIVEVPVSITYFKDRQSRVFSGVISYSFNTLLIIMRAYRDFFPLRFFGSIALICFIPGLIFTTKFFVNFFTTGQFSGYLFAGLLGAFFMFLFLVFLLIGLVTDMLDRIRTNQERILYRLKKQNSKNEK